MKLGLYRAPRYALATDQAKVFVEPVAVLDIENPLFRFYRLRP
jgi:hypothetical protein